MAQPGQWPRAASKPMDVLVLIDKLDDLVHNAKPVPLTDQVRVDKEEIYDILDQMRATIPEEIKQARWIVKERQEMLAEAKKEAERIIKDARERQERLVGEEEVTKQAERAAEDIVEDARAREREIRLGAEDYADEILNTLEVNLSKFIAAVQRGRERLQGKDEPAEVSYQDAAARRAPVSSRARGRVRHAPASLARSQRRPVLPQRACARCIRRWVGSGRWTLGRSSYKLQVARALLGTGIVHPERPDKTLRSLAALRRWGPSSPAAYAGGAARFPDRPAIVDDRGTLTFAEVASAHERAGARARGDAASANRTAWRSCAATTAASSRRRSRARSSARARCT